MKNVRGFKQKLSIIERLCEEQQYDAALSEIEAMRETWPGNAHLLVLWASIVQLQENPTHELDEVKQALQQAIELDKGSPTALIELGHYLDHVEDDPKSASKVLTEGVINARHQLIEGLIAQVKVFRQLEKREEYHRCLSELIHLTRFDVSPKRTKAEERESDFFLESLAGNLYALQIKGPYTDQIQELLSDVLAERVASK